jgi:hypothetical protein
MTAPKQTFVINRQQWIRGEDEPVKTTRLWTSHNRGCCLGHVALQCGMAKDRLLDLSEPFEVVERGSDAVDIIDLLIDRDTGCYGNSDLAGAAMTINDSKHIDDAKRESRLVDLFASHGYAIEFVDTAEQLDARLAELRSKP